MKISRVSGLLLTCLIVLSGCITGPKPPLPDSVLGKVSVDFNGFICEYGSPGGLAKDGQGVFAYGVRAHNFDYDYYVYYTPNNLNGTAPIPWYPRWGIMDGHPMQPYYLIPGVISNQEDDELGLNVPKVDGYNLSFSYIEWGSSMPVPANTYGNNSNCANALTTYGNGNGGTTQLQRCYRHGKMLSFASGFIPTPSIHVVLDVYAPNNSFTCDCYKNYP